MTSRGWHVTGTAHNETSDFCFACVSDDRRSGRLPSLPWTGLAIRPKRCLLSDTGRATEEVRRRLEGAVKAAGRGRYSASRGNERLGRWLDVPESASQDPCRLYVRRPSLSDSCSSQ